MPVLDTLGPAAADAPRCRSPTAATFAATTACRRTSTSGCRARICSRSRRSAGSRISSASSVSTALRLTGGEPLLRRNLPALDRRARRAALASRPGADDQRRAARRRGGRTQAGGPASPHREPRHAARRSLPAPRARGRARRRCSPASRRPGAPDSPDLKLDAVITRGDNDDELVDLVDFARDVRRGDPLHRVHGRRRRHRLAARRRRLARRDAGAAHGPLRPDRRRSTTPGSSAPAARFRLPDGLTFGIIASTTQPFCRTCDRARLTADGVLLLCLYAQHGTDLRRPLRAGASRRDAARG